MANSSFFRRSLRLGAHKILFLSTYICGREKVNVCDIFETFIRSDDDAGDRPRRPQSSFVLHLLRSRMPDTKLNFGIPSYISRLFFPKILKISPKPANPKMIDDSKIQIQFPNLASSLPPPTSHCR
ncbi:hypothetical protein LXL04_003114 [Taraxacum kok-saghyz]